MNNKGLETCHADTSWAPDFDNKLVLSTAKQGTDDEDNNRGLRRICVLSPRYIFFFFFSLFLTTNSNIYRYYMYNNAGTPPFHHTTITLPLQTTTKTLSCRSTHERGSRCVLDGWQGQQRGLEMHLHLEPQVHFLFFFFHYSSLLTVIFTGTTCMTTLVLPHFTTSLKNHHHLTIASHHQHRPWKGLETHLEPLVCVFFLWFIDSDLWFLFYLGSIVCCV